MVNANTLESWLIENKAWNDEMEAALAESGFEQPENAWRILIALSRQSNFTELYPRFFSTFLNTLSQSYNPDIALNNFQRLTQEILDKDHLYSLLSGSPFLLNALTVLISGLRHAVLPSGEMRGQSDVVQIHRQECCAPVQ